MAVPTARPSSSGGKQICWADGCHAQLLESLTPRAFLQEKRYGEADGYWVISIAIEKCAKCQSDLLTRLYGDDIRVVDICLTNSQYAEAVTSCSVGAATGAPDRVHNGNIQLANMRANTVIGKKADSDTVYKMAVFQFWPYISALLASGESDALRSRSSRCGLEGLSTFLCGGRQTVLRASKWWPVSNHAWWADVLNYGSPPGFEDEPDEDKPTADEQIHGKPADRVACKIPFCEFVVDDDPTTGIKTEDDALGVRFGPCTQDSKFYDNTPNRVADAIKGRITDKQVPFGLNDDQRLELADITEHLCNELKNSGEVQRIASWLLFGDIKSKKWSISRAELALNVLMWQLNPDFTFAAAIKLEPMLDGKPPRMLIADGDAGAVMSALSIGVLERYLCKYHKRQTIKGCAKGKRIDEICKDAYCENPRASSSREGMGMGHKAFLVENDGSAWDTCCSLALRELTENRVLDVMHDLLYPFITPYNAHADKRKAADKQEKYKMFVNSNKLKVDKMVQTDKFTYTELAQAMCKRRFKVAIDAIRRSGDRGTSILNWIVNKICWIWVLVGPLGAATMHVNGQILVDIFGVRRRYKFWFEGDDSLLWLTGRVFTEAEQEVLRARWVVLGHRPKLWVRTEGDVAEFCGWKVCVTEFGLDATSAVPDLPRMLRNCFYSCDKAAVKACREGDIVALGRSVGPALIARASSIACRVPTVARWLCILAAGFHATIADESFSREDMYRMGKGVELGDLLPEWWKDDDPQTMLDQRYESFLDNVNRQVSNCLSCDGLTHETELAIKHGWVKDAEEWRQFADALNAVTLSTTPAEMRLMLPEGMH